MERTKLTGQQEKLVRALFDSFVSRDYPDCLSKIFDLGMTLGNRYFTPILHTGINFEIDREPSLQVALIYTVASFRLGDIQAAEGPFMMNAVGGGEIRAWLNTLLALLFRRITFDAALKGARTEVQRVQVHYYEGESLLTDRLFTRAPEMFARSLDLTGECPEKEFARARLGWLRTGDLPS